jgi:hypothetical protein
MREILPGNLWLGNAGDGRDPERLLQAGVLAVINLAAEEPSPTLPRSMVYCHFPIMDGTQDGQGIILTALLLDGGQTFSRAVIAVVAHWLTVIRRHCRCLDAVHSIFQKHNPRSEQSTSRARVACH